MTATDLAAISEEFLTQCGSCDAGIPTACTCSKRDHRPVMLDLVREVEQLREESGHQRTIIVELDRTDTERLRRWLEHPNGALTTDTDMRHLPRRGLTVEAVEHGGVWFRVVDR